MWLTENGSVTGSLLTETGFSHAKMGRVSSIVKRLSLKVVEQFHNIVPRCKIVTTLNVLSFSLHIIISRSNDLEKSLCAIVTGARDPRALKPSMVINK